MKAYQTQNGTNWIELLPYEFSQEELNILYDPENKDYQSTVNRIMEAKTSIIIDSTFLVNILNNNLPSIPEGYSFNLLSCDIVDEDGIYSGLINYRLNNEHIQIRFQQSK